MPFSVILCGAHPHSEDFDHCWTGEDFETLAEARKVFEAEDPIAALAALDEPKLEHDPAREYPDFRQIYSDSTHLWLIETCGPDSLPSDPAEVDEVRELPAAKKKKNRSGDQEWPEHSEGRAECNEAWLSEQAHQAGMAFGCQGYNEVMGWD